MEDFFEANLAIISRRWPDVGQRICNADFPDSVEIDESGTEPALVVNGLHLSSIYDRLREAELQATLIPASSETAWVYGLGMAVLPRVLLMRSVLKRMNVVLFNPKIAKAVFYLIDHRDWLNDERVELQWHADHSDVCFPFSLNPPSLQLAEVSAYRLRDLVSLTLATPHIQKKHETKEADYRKRLDENESFIAQDGDVKFFWDESKKHSIVVIGAGPTLSQHYGYLKAHRDKHYLIVVDAALKPLLEAGIKPDVCVTQDPTEKGVLRFFSGISDEALAGVSLLYFPLTPGRILTDWPGPRFVSYTQHPRYQLLLQKYPKGTLFSAGSVIHPATDLAVKMGGNPVILMGADFSFPGGDSHVLGSPAHSTSKKSRKFDWLVNGYGQKVQTIANLKGYLRDLESYILKNPEVIFINSSKDGARIEGTVYSDEVSL